MVAWLFLLLSLSFARFGRGFERPATRFPGVSSFASGVNSVVDVTDYGAKGDGTTDNIKAFQNALNAIGAQGGGVVWVPAGQYRLNSSLTVPKATTLQGTYEVVPSHSSFTGVAPSDGTVLLPYGGKGNENGTPFISLNENSALRGVVIYYPEQLANPKGNPTPYPWSVNLTDDNAAITDVELMNPWNAVSAIGSARHYIARIQGQPINTGLFVDETYDIGRIEDVHWNPWWSQNVNITTWQALFGRGFVIARSDWEYVFNTFCFGYAVGYHFITSESGSMNGNFLGIGADLAFNASVKVDGAQDMGILITNGEFTAFDADWFCPSCNTTPPYQVLVTSSNTGPVQFVNSAFWGPSSQIANIQGTGMVSFVNCQFVYWDGNDQGLSAIETDGADLIVQGSNFQLDKNQITIGPNTNKTIVLGNIIKGAQRILNKSKGNVQIGYNAAG